MLGQWAESGQVLSWQKAPESSDSRLQGGKRSALRKDVLRCRLSRGQLSPGGVEGSDPWGFKCVRSWPLGSPWEDGEGIWSACISYFFPTPGIRAGKGRFILFHSLRKDTFSREGIK